MFKKILIWSTASAIAIGVLANCVSRDYGDNDSVPTRLLTEQDDFADYGFTHGHSTGYFIGLQKKEIALTLDDGPRDESLALAKRLAAMDVPVTYFMIGQNASSRTTIIDQISKLKLSNGNPATIIANHSWSHHSPVTGRICIACDGAAIAIQEIVEADKVLAPFIIKQNKPFLFRAPGGNFFRDRSDEVAQLQDVNAKLDRYIGPFRWDVSGDADGCTNNSSACLSSYISQTEARAKNEGVIVLAHDAILATHDWLPSYVSTMKSKGYKFVAMDAYPDKLAKYGTIPQNEVGITNVTFSTTPGANGMTHFSASVKNAAHLEVYIDGLATPLFKVAAGSLEADRKISDRGARQFLIKGYDAAGKTVGRSIRYAYFNL